MEFRDDDDSSYHMDTREVELPDDELYAADLSMKAPSDDMMSGDDCQATDTLVFSSLDTHFSVMVFFEQFFFHIFFPLSVPYAWYRYGTTQTQLQDYHFSSIPAYVFTFAPFLCMSAAVICLVAEPEVLNYGHLVVPFGLFAIHRMMVAVKYATLSPDEYR
jgi:hypothetical protein